MKSLSKIQLKIQELFTFSPIVALLGPRQVGKTTLAKSLGLSSHFDLENPAHELVLTNPEMAFKNSEELIVIDEVQRMPSLFPFLRYWVDENPQKKFLLLGSASRDLVNKSSESLAGRIVYLSIDGFHIDELDQKESALTLWQRGGFPRSFLAPSDQASLIWRQEYIKTFLERDIPGFGIKLPAPQMRRLWTMLANSNGAILNYSELGRAFGLSDVAVRRYVEVLESTLMVRVLKPWFENINKRQVKKPKIYIRDSGLLHALLGLVDIRQSPKLGASWESFVTEQVIGLLSLENPMLSEEGFYFWRSVNDEEIDLFFQYNGKNYGIEVKYSNRPEITKSLMSAKEKLSLEKVFIVNGGTLTAEMQSGIYSISIDNLHSINKILTGI